MHGIPTQWQMRQVPTVLGQINPSHYLSSARPKDGKTGATKRKGEKGTRIVFFKQLEKEDRDMSIPKTEYYIQ